MNLGHTILLYVVIAAALFIAFDGLIESYGVGDSKHKLSTDVDGIDWTPGSTKKTSLETQYTMVCAYFPSRSCNPVCFLIFCGQIPIDHDDPSSGTFSNRYWINSEFYQPGGPVFVYDTGEVNAVDSVERMLERPTSFMGELLEEFHGLGILWEHR